MPEQSERIAIVTGASSGIGRAIALQLAAHRFTPVLIGRDVSALEKVVAAIPVPGITPHCLSADLSDLETVDRLGKRIAADFHGADVLVHAAGVAAIGTTIRDSAPEILEQHFRVNVSAPYRLTRALLPLLVAHQGQVVFINSTLGLSSKASAGAYGMSKHALKALADTLRDEVNSEGIRVLSVFVGRTATPMQAVIHKQENRTYHPERLLQPEDIAVMVGHALSLPRTAEVTDINIRPMLKPLS